VLGAVWMLWGDLGIGGWGSGVGYVYIVDRLVPFCCILAALQVGLRYRGMDSSFAFRFVASQGLNIFCAFRPWCGVYSRFRDGMWWIL
jgi:hypothetical protein